MVRARIWIAPLMTLALVTLASYGMVGCAPSSGAVRGQDEAPTSADTEYNSRDDLINKIDSAATAMEEWLRTRDYDRTLKYAEVLEVYCGDLQFFIPTEQPYAVQEAYRSRTDVIYSHADAVLFQTRLHRLTDAQMELTALVQNLDRLRTLLRDPSMEAVDDGKQGVRFSDSASLGQ